MASSKHSKRDADRAIRIAMGVMSVAGACVLAFGVIGLGSEADDGGAALMGDLGTPPSEGGETRPQLPTASESTTPTLSGRVVDTAGVGIASVSVTVSGELAAPWRTSDQGNSDRGDGGPTSSQNAATAEVVTTTAADGSFSFVDQAPGLYRLRIEGQRVVTAEVRYIEVPTTALEVTSLRQVEIGGRLIGALPSEDVAVIARGELGEETTTANPDGSFLLSALPEGVYRLWAEGTEVGSVAIRLEARGLGPFDSLELELVKTTSVVGRLLDRESGAAVAGAVVFSSETGEPERRAESDADGAYRVGALLPGRWVASASASGYIPSEQLAFEADRNRTLDLQLSVGGEIEGIVVNPDGAPVAGAFVESVGGPIGGTAAKTARRAAMVRHVVSAAGAQFVPRGELGVLLGPIPFPPIGRVATVRVAQPVPSSDSQTSPSKSSERISRTDGHFRLVGLRAGTYRVRASHPDFAGGVTKAIAVELGRRRGNVRVVLRRGTHVRGRVTDSENSPIAAAVVTAKVPGSTPLRVLTDADGRYQLPPITGATTVAASATGHASASKLVPVVKDGTERVVDLVLARADKSISGQVTDSAGLPVGGAYLAVLGTGLGSATDDVGRFGIVGLAAGTHEVDVTHRNFPPLRTRLETGDSVAIKLPIGGGVSGELRDELSGASIAEAMVEARRGKRAFTTRSADNGQFSIAPLAAGTWTLTVVAASYARVSKTLEIPSAPHPGEVTVADLRIDLVRGATLAGVVRDENGERVVGATVRVGDLQTTTDIDGRFRLADVPARGKTTLEVSAESRSGQERIELAPGDERSTLDVRIAPTP